MRVNVLIFAVVLVGLVSGVSGQEPAARTAGL